MAVSGVFQRWMLACHARTPGELWAIGDGLSGAGTRRILGRVEPWCVIFDLDGTLVDSEGLCHQAMLDLLPELAEPVAALTERYRGVKLDAIMADLAARIGRALPEDFELRYRARVSVLFEDRLKPVAGVEEMLASLRCAKCVASGGPPDKIRQSLSLSGLAEHFGDKVFSSYVVKSWKPDPGLFLHAARAMGYRLQRCVVVEDSDVGITAALAAGMTAMRFTPHGGTDGGEGVVCFNEMAELPGLIERLSGRAGGR